jgi:hypothetical protein
MDEKPHKAHRPARSGSKVEKKDKAKGKDKQRGFNEKVCSRFEVLAFSSTKILRHLLRNPVDEQTVKVDAMSNAIKLGFTFLW